MASLGSPKAWIPYMNSRDCSQGFCSLYCPQWCSMFYPPPPHFEFPDDNASPTFSPLVIAIIGILASAFLLVSYYTIISKYCGNNGSAGRRDQNHNNHNEEFEDNRNPSLREPWDVATTGLDEALIKSITVCKYKKGDGLIGVTDCSVCLSEFKEDENVRLLPKCSHAFHLPCIDTWLKSHSNCPLCRANIFFISAPLPLPPSPPPFAHENPQSNQPALHENQHGDDNINVTQQNTEVDHASEEEVVHNDTIPKSPLRVSGDNIVEIRDEFGCHQHLRRSVSMDHQSCRHPRRSAADVLSMNQDHQVIEVEEEFCMEDIVGSPKSSAEESKCNCRRKVLNCSVPSHTTMKRSLSSGRFFLSRH